MYDSCGGDDDVDEDDAARGGCVVYSVWRRSVVVVVAVVVLRSAVHAARKYTICRLRLVLRCIMRGGEMSWVLEPRVCVCLCLCADARQMVVVM
jgi:hypothetical protein